MSADILNFQHLLELEHIRGMAPDHTTLRAADELARNDRWGLNGWSGSSHTAGRLLWAEFPETRRPAIHTTASLPGMHLTCTCAATRFPCRHLIALLARDAVGALAHEAHPGWAARPQRARQGDSPASDPAADAGRRAALVAGMADLQRWLGDIVGEGMAGLAKRNREPWLNAANRLVDAYAFEAARELQAMSRIPGSSPDWPERFLPRMGRLALLCEAFKRLDDLSPAERGDALAAAGRPPRPEGTPVYDTWRIIGHRMEADGKKLRSRTWLYGLRSQRWALLADNHTVGRLDGFYWPTGATVEGELAFLPSAWPVAARPGDSLHLIASKPDHTFGFASDIEPAVAGYAAALAANPWLNLFPMALSGVFVEPPATSGSANWRVRDRGGRVLPLPEKFAHGWRLLSLAADRPLSLFGEWDGMVLTPLSVYVGDWRAMSGWRGLA